MIIAATFLQDLSRDTPVTAAAKHGFYPLGRIVGSWKCLRPAPRPVITRV
jgi:hypothetical protein